MPCPSCNDAPQRRKPVESPIQTANQALDPDQLMKMARPLKARPEAADSDRVTCIIQVHHEQRGFQPTTVDARGSRRLDTKGVERFQRRFREIGEEPMPLDLGWVEQPGYVVIENVTGRGRPTNPTPEEREADEASILCLERVGAPEGLGTLAWVRLGNPFAGELYDPSTVTIRCLKGTAAAVVTIHPE